MAGTAKGNPFTAATNGQWSFYVDSRIDVKLSGGGIPSPFTLGDLAPSEASDVLDCSSFPGDDGGERMLL